MKLGKALFVRKYLRHHKRTTELRNDSFFKMLLQATEQPANSVTFQLAKYIIRGADTDPSF